MTPSDKTVKGFSKLSKKNKIEWLASQFHDEPESLKATLESFEHSDEGIQKILDGFSENTISNFAMPYSIAPNFVINGKPYSVPMVIEESSVVAAASKAAKFWMTRGGFKAEVIDTQKIGQIHFSCTLEYSTLKEFFKRKEQLLLDQCKDLLTSMESRGGGINFAKLYSFDEEPGYYQIRISFETCESMGANFINTILEHYAQHLLALYEEEFSDSPRMQIIMCILSNYTPDCIVRSEVSCPVEDLGEIESLTALQFAYKFHKAIRIAEIDPYRATTHNKGIYNGIDAVVLATGNDFRAIEACGHTYASKDGQYRSLTHCTINEGIFRYWIDVPLAVGTVGGLTKLHPLAKVSLEIMGHPTSKELMMIIASVGLAQNFGAVKSLITTGIQKGHMKMHLFNVLHQLKATEKEFKLAVDHFKDKIISHSAVKDFLAQLRIGPIESEKI